MTSLYRCPTGKLGHRTVQLALEHLEHLKKVSPRGFSRKRVKTLDVYFCRRCGKWHVGHKRKPKILIKDR